MGVFNSVISSFFEAVLFPFRGMAPFWGLFVISVLTGIAMLLLFRVTSNQEGIRRIRNRIRAHVLEIRLFKDDLGLMFRAQGSILRHTVVYMRMALRPLLFILPVVVVIMIQLDLRYGRSPLEPGESTVVTARLLDGASVEDVELAASSGLAIETPAVRIPSRGEVSWRIRALEPGEQNLFLETGEGRVEKKIRVRSGRVVPVEPARIGGSLLGMLEHPGEPPLDGGTGVEEIRVDYRGADVPVFGLGMHWLIPFCVVSLAAGFALKNAFHVEL
jgi:hypothetical protein